MNSYTTDDEDKVEFEGFLLDDYKHYDDLTTFRYIEECRREGVVDIDLSNLGLQEVPSNLGEILVLNSLNLKNNRLPNLPQNFEQLRLLTSMNLSGNVFTSLPETILQLHLLIQLDLSSNRLTILSDNIGRLQSLTSLDLSGNLLTTLPKSILHLQSLTFLDLRLNPLKIVPETITQLKALTSLDLSYTSLTGLPESIGQLQKLTFLNLSRNELVSLPESIGQLQKLAFLGLRSNRLIGLPNSIEKLQTLASLDVSYTLLTELSESIFQLHSLVSLDVSGNRIKSLPEKINQLRALTSLNLSRNILGNIPETIGQLGALTYLNLSSNELVALPESIRELRSLITLNLEGNKLTELSVSIGQLDSLTYLDLSENELVVLPESIGELQSLTFLNLSKNSLTTLPYSITRLLKLERINLKDNPNLSIPNEFLENSWNVNVKALFDYLHATHRDRPVLLNEVKLLVVGEANVGKTTLVTALLGNSVEIDNREPTSGIAVRDDILKVGDRKVLVHFWDFGGQEIMHNTHRLFLTTRSCYLLVLDATQNEESNKVVEWLKTIHLYAPDAPVILVINKWDKYQLKLNVQALDKLHPIAKVIETSCATGEGIKQLRTTIQREMGQLKHLNDEIPAKWMEVRHQVGNENKNYIDYQEFERTCEAHGVETGTYGSVADLLHALGVLFTYSNNPTVKLTHILNPNWVTGGIYPILNDPELLKGSGFVTDNDIERILHPKGYPRDKHPFIISMMAVFELSFEIGQGRYLVPDLLPKVPPVHEWEEKGALKFIYQYDFVPPGLFSRFVVRMQEEVNPKQVWRTGVILWKRGIPYGRVVVDTDTKCMEIAIALPVGNSRDRRALLDDLRDKFQRLHEDYKGVEMKELVPIGDTGALVEYRKLVYWTERGLYQQSDPDAGDFDVRELMNGITARGQGYDKPVYSEQTSPRERRKRLFKILLREFEIPGHLRKFFFMEGLEEYISKIKFDTDAEEAYQDLIIQLEIAGKYPDSEETVLGIFLNALAEKASGHPHDVVFLRVWAREL